MKAFTLLASCLVLTATAVEVPRHSKDGSVHLERLRSPLKGLQSPASPPPTGRPTGGPTTTPPCKPPLWKLAPWRLIPWKLGHCTPPCPPPPPPPCPPGPCPPGPCHLDGLIDRLLHPVSSILELIGMLKSQHCCCPPPPMNTTTTTSSTTTTTPPPSVEILKVLRQVGLIQ